MLTKRHVPNVRSSFVHYDQKKEKQSKRPSNLECMNKLCFIDFVGMLFTAEGNAPQEKALTSLRHGTESKKPEAKGNKLEETLSTKESKVRLTF